MIFPIIASITLTFLYLHNKRKLLIAPMIGGLDSCFFKKQELKKDTPNSKYTKLCLEDEDSPSRLIEATLNGIVKNNSKSENYKLGYTLYIPLLKLFDIKDSGYEINRIAIRRFVKSIEHVDKPVILYLFSDHFSVDSPIEDALAKNPNNILQSAKGSLPIDKYYGANVYPWSFVNTENEITHLRENAFHAILDEVCRLPNYALKRVEGVTMLGELHHMFPDFQAGMGFSGDYLISDYSKHSAEGFRKHLSNKYVTIAALNQYLGSNFSDFEEILPPSKNIRSERLNNYWEHIDAYAHGILPISGWVAQNPQNTTEKDWVHIYNNGELLTRVPVELGRQDVLAAHPEMPSSNVGWKYNLDYSKIPPGIHRIDVFLKRGSDPLAYLTTRNITIMEKSQATPRKIASKTLPQSIDLKGSILFSIDSPSDLSSYYYNPLALLWHDFRKQQITQYLEHFSNIAKKKCIDPQLIYSHQILPFVNPGWDESKFSVGTDLAVPSDIRLGISLYGEASYGTSFFDWFGSTHRTIYGVTEFHPLKAMNAIELNSVLNQHYKNNAQFLSFFVEGIGLDEDTKNKPNIFSFDKKNKNAGSDILFESIKEILK